MTSNEQIITRIQAGRMEPFALSICGRRTNLRLECSRHYRRKGHTLYEFSYSEEKHPLRIVLKVMDIDDYPVLKLSLNLYAEKGISGHIHNVNILNFNHEHRVETPNAVLRGITGGFIDRKDNFPFPPNSLKLWDSEIKKGIPFKLDSGYTGKSSSFQVPLWLYTEEKCGIWFGPEWSGTWSLELLRIGMTTRISVGLPALDFKMYQGECIRLPWVTIGGYEGDFKDGYNHLRRTIYNLFMPLVNGERPIPQVVYQGVGGHDTYHDEKGLLDEVKIAHKMGAEAFVTHGGWYQSHKHKSISKGDNIIKSEVEEREIVWFETLGDYFPHPERFPSGFDTFVDSVHGLGMKMGLWIDPRIHENTQVYQNYNDAVIPPESKVVYEDFSPYNGVYRLIVDIPLLDLAKDEGREFFYDTLKRFVTDYRMDWIWFDINTDMRTLYWDHYEEENRKGLLELRYYHGFYDVLDRIRREHPNVWIEACGSGGTLIDLAIIGRCNSFYVDDFVGFDKTGQPFDIDINRHFRSGLNNFLPAVYIQNAMYIPTKIQQSYEEFGIYNYLCHFAGTIDFGQGLLYWKERDVEIATKCMDVYKRIRHYLLGDYYLLCPLPEKKDGWDVRQYHVPESGSGIIMVFQLPKCSEFTKALSLSGIKDDIDDYSFDVILGDGSVEPKKDTLKVTVGQDRCVLIQYIRRLTQ